MGKGAWAGSQEASNEQALMSRHLSHWWVNSRSAQEEPEPGMQGAQEEPGPNREAGNHLSAGARLDPKCSQGPLFAFCSQDGKPTLTIASSSSPGPTPGPLPRMFHISKSCSSPSSSFSSSIQSRQLEFSSAHFSPMCFLPVSSCVKGG